MFDSEDIEYSLELPIGMRFYFKNQLYEVVELNSRIRCPECAFFNEFLNDPMCQIMLCNKKDRHDKKHIFLKEVKELEGETNNG